MQYTTKFPFAKIIIAGLIVGTLDITGACIDAWFSAATPVPPQNILYFIAKGLIGDNAAAGGFFIGLLGLCIHYCIAVSFTLFFYIIYRYMKQVLVYPLLMGFCYGIFIWATMRYLVLPFTHIKVAPFDFKKAAKAALILVAAIGVPLSFLMPWVRKKD
ncbi:MAG: hypothetical protein JST86_17295 [Bacteroidetes bacterium]|nr:hypothetical protein [Bacteroidota bacterium]